MRMHVDVSSLLPKSCARSMSNSLGPDTTLGELVVAEGASVRLTNCVQRSTLAALTISQTFEMGPSLDAVCLRVPAMGRKSVRELHELLDRVAARSATSLAIAVEEQQDSSLPRHNEDATAADLFNYIGGLYSTVTLGEAVQTIGASVRLTHGIERAPIRTQPLGQILLQWGQSCRDLLQIKNFGRTSLQELRQICNDLIHDHFAVSGLAEPESRAVCAMLFGGSAMDSEDCALLMKKLAGLPAFSFDVLRSGDIRSPEELAETLIQDLDDRSRDILIRRYGLRGHVSETLEQIAEGYDVTRERIRQLESKALKKLALKGAKLTLHESLLGHGAEIWKTLVGENDYLKISDLTSRLAIAPCVRILMDVQGISMPELLDLIACRWQDGWCRSDIDTNALDRVKVELAKVLLGRPMPRLLPPLSSEERPEIVRLGAALGLGLRTYKGYVLSDEMTVRSQVRVIDLHRHLGGNRLPYNAAELASRLGGDHRGSSTSARYVTMVMERHPHLFLEADDGQWFGIGGRAFEDAEATELPTEPAADNEEYEEEAFTTARLLREILQEEGPTKLSRVVEIASSRLPPERSIASVGPTLIMNPEIFIRVLPGVYALKRDIPSTKVIFEQKPAYLLNADQARYYALARKAGEPWGTFPLWSPAAEAALCSWALENADASILQSLVSVATFDAWPVDEATKHAWKDFAKKRNARFLLHFQPRDGVGYALPKLDRLLAACLEARSCGLFNWMVGNRILKRPVYSHISAGLMALMCSLDALKIDPDSHWQLPHSCGPNLEHLILLLSGELHDNGALDWASPLGARILKMAGDAIGRWSGWVDRQLLATMLGSVSLAGGSRTATIDDFIGKAVEAELNDLTWTTEEVASEPSRSLDGAGLIGYSALEVTSARILSADEDEWSFEDDFTD